MREGRATPDVERIDHTGSSPEGTNSTYVLPEHGVVVDPGPPGDHAWDVLGSGFQSASVSIEDVEAVVVTHWHADHAGLAPRLAERADAELFLHEADAPLVGDYAAERGRRVERDARTLRGWGVPDRVVDAVVDGDDPSPMPDTTPVTSVTQGDQIRGTDVVHTPGHTAGHVAISAGDALFVGDAVLPTYTPNVGGSDTRVERPLSTYLDTLDGLLDHFGSDDAAAPEADRESRAVRAFPGHGPTVALRSRITEIREHHADRLRNAVRSLPRVDSDSRDEDEPDSERATEAGGRGRTPWQVARDLFGEMSGIHAKMGAGEAAAHLRFGVEAGLAVRTDSDPDRYARVGDAADERFERAVSASRYR